jgi:Uncharacterized protein conserved in bacteria
MVDFKELKKILNSSGMGARHYSNGRVAVTDSCNFRGARQSALEEAQRLVSEAHRADMQELANRCSIKTLDTVESCSKRATQSVGKVIDCIGLKDAEAFKSKYNNSMTAVRDSIVNPRFNLGNAGIDPSLASIALPNVYISPWEAQSLYSQKGIFETIINKKAKSVLLNGLRFANPKLTSDEIDRIKERAELLNFKQVISDAMRDSLVYGGNLTFPMFRKDRPTTTMLPLSTLVKLGVVGKNCIDYFVQLDRWQVFIIPPYNPTQKDFIRPDYYTIPFLGGDVHHTRCARIVTARQAGYLGQVANQGWGISDLCGYLQSGMNYKVTMQAVPLMIQQMSILARTVNIDGVLATEGGNALDALVEQDTVRTREASPDNPITLDVLGNITAINRNFSSVGELLRLLRQDLASDAIIPEPMLWSSEKGNFASGDDTQGNLNKQWESIRMIHKDVEPQIKQLLKILVIDTLGTDRHVMEALPYMQLHFDEPVIANALEKAQIGKAFSENVFNLVSARLPIDVAVEMASQNVSEELAPSAGLLEKLSSIQEDGDKRDKINFDLDTELKKAQIEQAQASAEATERGQAGQTGNPKGVKGAEKGSSNEKTKGKSPAEEQREKAESDKKEHGYSRLEQKQHEKTRVGWTKRSEKEAKYKNKQV